MAKIVHVSTVHRAEDTRILHRQCRTLADAGHEVVLIARHPRDEVRRGVRIVALPLAPDYGGRGGRARRLASTLGLVRELTVAQHAEIHHLHDPELLGLGWWLARRGAKVVFDVHEDTALQLESKPWLWPAARPLAYAGIRCLERTIPPRLAGLVAAEPAHLDRFSLHRTPSAVVQNFPRLDEFAANGSQARSYLERSARLAYVGSLSRARGVLEMVRAVARVPEATGAELVLAGEMPPSLTALCEREPGWSRTVAAGFTDRTGVATLLGDARIGLCLLHPEPNYVDAWPTKLFEYMAAGLPVIASDFPLWRGIVEDAGCGVVVDPLDVDAIANAAAAMLRNPAWAMELGRRGREAFERRYAWEREGQKLLMLYTWLLEGRAHG